MVLLNHFRSFLLYAIFILPLEAGVVAFFDPNKVASSPHNIQSNLSYLIASEPISLEGMFNDWDGNYHPKSNTNIAMQDMRFDIGTEVFNDYYLGYFYRYNIHIKAGKDFTDFFYRTKNHLDLDPTRTYGLNLNIEGIEQSGLILAHNKVIFDNGNDSVKIGGAFSFTVGHDMQHGSINGKATVPSEKSYEASGEVSSYYTHNYLYDLDVRTATAYGYGSDFSIAYKNKAYDLEVDFIVNDLWSKMYWKNLPYSHVNIDTKNESFDEDGYVHYRPSISGTEVYVNYTQTIDSRYRIEASKGIKKDLTLTSGTDFVYDTFFPYILVNKYLSDSKNLLLSYENKFKSFGVDYRDEIFSIGITSDGIQNVSTFGLRGALFYPF
jgi:hypothetical protein